MGTYHQHLDVAAPSKARASKLGVPGGPSPRSHSPSRQSAELLHSPRDQPPAKSPRPPAQALSARGASERQRVPSRVSLAAPKARGGLGFPTPHPPHSPRTSSPRATKPTAHTPSEANEPPMSDAFASDRAAASKAAPPPSFEPPPRSEETS